MSENYLKPKTKGLKSPTADQQINGNIINPRVNTDIGGIKSGAWKQGHVTIAKPGPGKKVI